jgi:spore photoproduct lyase
MIDRLNYRDAKNEMHVVSKRGEAMGICATLNIKYLCCNVHVLRSVQNCPFECSYCFLQNYLTDGIPKSVGDVDELIAEVRRKVAAEPERLFRIGTWELGDSLAWEERTGQAAQLVRAFSELDNAVLELKTKSDKVDSLLNIDHKGRTVVSWSLNADHIVRTEEHRTASLKARLTALNTIARAGYLVGLHFDPMIRYEKWEKGYRELVGMVFDVVDPGRIAWISIGSLRFNPEMKKKIENNYPDSKLTIPEMVLGDDAKVRYVKPLRVEMYGYIYSELKKIISDSNLVYLCMERWDVWDKVLGYHPESIEHLDYIFARSLYERYRIGPKKPEREDYEKE